MVCGSGKEWRCPQLPFHASWPMYPSLTGLEPQRLCQTSCAHLHGPFAPIAFLRSCPQPHSRRRRTRTRRCKGARRPPRAWRTAARRGRGRPPPPPPSPAPRCRARRGPRRRPWTPRRRRSAAARKGHGDPDGPELSQCVLKEVICPRMGHGATRGAAFLVEPPPCAPSPGLPGSTHRVGHHEHHDALRVGVHARRLRGHEPQRRQGAAQLVVAGGLHQLPERGRAVLGLGLEVAWDGVPKQK